MIHTSDPNHIGPAETADLDDDSPDAIIKRMKLLFADQATALDELIELSGDIEKKERFEALLEDLAYEALLENEEFTTNATEMRSGKLSTDEQQRIRDRQRELLESYKKAIIRKAGLPDEAGQSDIEKSKATIREIIDRSITSSENTGPLHVLEELDIIVIDEDGKEHFHYPEGLFPKNTDDKWLTYLETVRTHLRLDRAVHTGTAAKEELEEVDKVRRMAHNAVTRDVDDILGFSTLPDTKWDFSKTRNLLAKMRDSRFPTVETSERFRTETALVEAMIGAHALKALSTRLSDLHK